MRAVGSNPARCLTPIRTDPTLRARVVATPAAINGLSQATGATNLPRTATSSTTPMTTFTGSFWFISVTASRSANAGSGFNATIDNLLDAPASQSIAPPGFGATPASRGESVHCHCYHSTCSERVYFRLIARGAPVAASGGYRERRRQVGA